MADIGRCELIEGEIIPMAPAGCEHGGIEDEIYAQLRAFVTAHQLGRMFPSDTGFLLRRNPDTVRATDGAFVRKDRLPQTPRRGYFEGAPDLAVEVISPSDSWPKVLDKVSDWLQADTAAVWVADPPNKTIHVYRPDQPPMIYQGDGELRDETLLPGFALKLAEVFR